MAVRSAAVTWGAALVISCGLLALPLVAFGATSAVTIQNSAFNPPTTPVRVGDTVMWTNRDAVGHTSTSDAAVWDSPVLGTGSSFSFTFMVAGTFTYHCSIHTFMKGSIVVQAAATPAPTPPPTPAPTAPPTPVRTAPPTAAPTVAPTAPPTTEPTAAPTTPPPSATPSATVAAAEPPAISASPSAVAVQVTPAPIPNPSSSPGPILIAAAALAVVALGAIAFFLARRP
jgi:plastocyanin